MKLTPADYAPLIEGVGELTPNRGMSVVRRLPVDSQHLIVHPELLLVADMAAGAKVAFKTDASALELSVRTHMPKFEEQVAPFDVVVDGKLVARHVIEGEGVLTVGPLGPGDKSIEIWLPHFGATELGALTLLDAHTVVPASQERPHWICYGSSITQCAQSLGPSETWPAIVAAEHDWRATNLGFSGQCHLDPVVARMIRDSSADIISLCLGINVWGRSSMAERVLAPAIVGFIQTIREGHPTTPILVTTPIASPEREQKRNEAGLTLSEVRHIVAFWVGALRERGDAELHLVDGLTILGAAEAALLEDGLHPSPEGYRLMARRMSPHLAALALRSPKEVETP